MIGFVAVSRGMSLHILISVSSACRAPFVFADGLHNVDSLVFLSLL